MCSVESTTVAWYVPLRLYQHWRVDGYGKQTLVFFSNERLNVDEWLYLYNRW